jgi:endonuclease/exonuclease/phosphatase family metal-dependent hydrolase
MSSPRKKYAYLGGLILALGCLLLAGCGVKTGYAPAAVKVYRGAALEPPPAVPDSLKVMSWNIQYGERVAQALVEIQADSTLADADIILVQEMTREGIAEMARVLGMHHVYGLAAVHPHHQKLFGNGVLSRWPIVADKAIQLPHETLITGHRRIAVAADINLGDQVVRAVSIHTATVVMDLDKRVDQAKAARDSLGEFAGPVIMGGDFNTVTDYEVTLLRQTMRRLRLDTVRLPAGPTIANKVKKVPGSVPVLDHIFVKDFTAGSRGIAAGATASDHYPIWAVLAVPPAGAEKQ